MNYRVTIRPQAQLDILEIWSFIAEAQLQPLVAERWLDGIERAIASLQRLPRRGRVVHVEFLGRESGVRQILFHNHRIFYTVAEREVAVLHVRRGTQQLRRSGPSA